MSKSQTGSSTEDFTATLLARSHSPTTAARIYAEKIKQKPLILVPPLNTSASNDARDARRKQREQQLAQKRRSRKTKAKQAAQPLSAKEKRAKGIYEIPKSEAKWSIYVGLEQMWCAYMRDILGLDKNATSIVGQGKIAQAARYGPLLASADFHGARITVVRSRCSSLVGLEGIVVREGKFSFTIITKKDEVKLIPKRGSVFSVRVALSNTEQDTEEKEASQQDEVNTTSSSADRQAGVGSRQDLVFEIYGDQFENRAAERATKRFKMHISKDL